MQQTIKNIRGVLIYIAVILLVSVAYYIYAYTVQEVPEERETLLTEIGDWRKLWEGGYGIAHLHL